MDRWLAAPRTRRTRSSPSPGTPRALAGACVSRVSGRSLLAGAASGADARVDVGGARVPARIHDTIEARLRPQAPARDRVGQPHRLVLGEPVGTAGDRDRLGRTESEYPLTRREDPDRGGSVVEHEPGRAQRRGPAPNQHGSLERGALDDLLDALRRGARAGLGRRAAAGGQECGARRGDRLERGGAGDRGSLNRVRVGLPALTASRTSVPAEGIALTSAQSRAGSLAFRTEPRPGSRTTKRSGHRGAPDGVASPRNGGWGQVRLSAPGPMHGGRSRIPGCDHDRSKPGAVIESASWPKTIPSPFSSAGATTAPTTACCTSPKTGRWFSFSPAQVSPWTVSSQPTRA